MSRLGGFESAGSATAWRKTIGRAVEPLFDVADCAERVDTLAKIRPVVCPEPSFGTTIASILGTTVLAGPVVDDADHRPTRDRQKRDPLVSNPVSARAHVTPREDSRAQFTSIHQPTGDPACSKRLPVVTPSKRTATEARCLPPRLDSDQIQAAAGTIDAPSNPSTRTGPPTRDRVGAGDEAPFLPTRLASPKPDAAGSRFESAIHQLAQVLGLDDTERMKDLVRTVPRPGPSMLAERLAPLALTERVEPAAPSMRAQTAPATTPPVSPQSPQRVGSELGETEPEAGTPTVAKPTNSPKTERETSPGTSAPGSVEGVAVRHAANHQELPHVPDRERATAQLPTGYQALRVPGDSGEAPIPGLSAVPVLPRGVERDDLERQMKSILDEAARRHGIEV